MKVSKWFLNWDFAGRGRRSHYWANLGCWLGVYIIAGIVITATAGKGDGPDGATPMHAVIILLVALASAIDGMAMVFRRAHDTGRSGWIWLILLIPVVNLLAFYWLMIEDSQQGPNKYGPPVKTFYEPPTPGAVDPAAAI